MNDNTKLELTLEIISTIIAKRYKEGFENKLQLEERSDRGRL